MSRKTIRTSVTHLRHQLTKQEHAQLSRRLLHTIGNRSEFLFSQRIAAYWPSSGEIDPRPLIDRALKMGKRCYLPVLHPIKPKQLLFYEYKQGDKLVTNRYGILEPIIHNRQAIVPWMLQLVLLPMVAFTQTGQRLGRGAGYYDRTFAFLKASEARHPKCIGLAYEFQRVDGIVQEDWDIVLDGIATEKRFIPFTLEC